MLCYAKKTRKNKFTNSKATHTRLKNIKGLKTHYNICLVIYFKRHTKNGGHISKYTHMQRANQILSTTAATALFLLHNHHHTLCSILRCSFGDNNKWSSFYFQPSTTLTQMTLYLEGGTICNLLNYLVNHNFFLAWELILTIGETVMSCTLHV